MKNEALNDYRLADGHLVACVYPGGYPVYYYDREQNVFCADCAEQHEEEILGATIYWEGPDVECDNCGEFIESAYGDNI